MTKLRTMTKILYDLRGPIKLVKCRITSYFYAFSIHKHST